MIFYLDECEEILSYKFKDKALLRQCFTHSSYTNENKSSPNYERLEFLGDSILGFVISLYLYQNDKNGNEGILTDKKKNLVSFEPLSQSIKKLGLEKFILHGNGQEINDKMCECIFESIVAGIYLDGGLEEAKKFIFRNLLNKKSVASKKNTQTKDEKSLLQEYLQKKHLSKPIYKVIDRKGPDHKPTFTVALYLDNSEKPFVTCLGQSKIEAEKLCAKNAYEKLTLRSVKK